MNLPSSQKKERHAHAETTAVRASQFFSLALFVGVLSYVIPRHEPWADEAQAWELAKNLSLKSLFGTYIHYEASPGLWHALLWVLTRMHVTYAGMHWITGVIAFVAMAILIFKAPFPLIIRLLLPFTYFFLYQYAVIARSYVLFPVILFALASIWHSRHRQLLPAVILVGLLANVSAHGLAVALGLSIVLTVEIYSDIKIYRQHWRNIAICALLLGALIGFAGWCMTPGPHAGWVESAKTLQSSKGWNDLISHTEVYHPRLRSLSFHEQILISLLLRFSHALVDGISQRFHLGHLIWALLLYTWIRRGLLRYALPILLLTFPFPLRTFNFYHAGLSWVVMLFLWWITWPICGDASAICDPPSAAWASRAVLVLVLLCIVFQLQWTGAAVKYDVAKAYSPDRDGAVLLREYLRQGNRVEVAVPSDSEGEGYGQFFVTGMEPYFEAEPIHNMPSRFWDWGGDSEIRTNYLQDSAAHTAVVVVEEAGEDPRYLTEENRLTAIGYHRDHEVCGQAFYPIEMGPSLCHGFYVP